MDACPFGGHVPDALIALHRMFPLVAALPLLPILYQTAHDVNHVVGVGVFSSRFHAKTSSLETRYLALRFTKDLDSPLGAAIAFNALDDLEAVADLGRCVAGIVR